MYFALFIALHLLLIKSDTKNASLKTNHEDHALVKMLKNLTNAESAKTKIATSNSNIFSDGKLKDWESVCKDAGINGINECGNCGCSFTYGYSDRIGCQCLEECEATTRIKDKRGIKDWNWKRFCKDGWNSKQCRDFMFSHGIRKEKGNMRAVKDLTDHGDDNGAEVEWDPWNHYDDEGRELIENLNITDIVCGCHTDNEVINERDDAGNIDYVDDGPENAWKPKCRDPKRVFLNTIHESPKLESMKTWLCRDEVYKKSADPEVELCGCAYIWHANTTERNISAEYCQCFEVPENTKGNIWLQKNHRTLENVCRKGWSDERCKKLMSKHGIIPNQRQLQESRVLHQYFVDYFQNKTFEVGIEKVHVCGCSKDHTFGHCYRYNS